MDSRAVSVLTSDEHARIPAKDNNTSIFLIQNDYYANTATF